MFADGKTQIYANGAITVTAGVSPSPQNNEYSDNANRKFSVAQDGNVYVGGVPPCSTVVTTKHCSPIRWQCHVC